jgi:23S rRNA (guanosine2251-2'-O)-methyltransferase
MHGGRGSGRSSRAPVRLWGRHAVEAALKNPDRMHRKLWATREGLDSLDGELPANFPLEYAQAADLGRLVARDAPHQGLVLECELLEDVFLEDVMSTDPARPLVFLDQVTDPHNVGAILRSAVAFDAGAVITTERHSPTESGVMAKSASGALEMIPYIQITNLADALEELHRLGFQTIGLDSDGPAALEGAFDGNKIALVLGAEGKGLRQKTRATCTALARLDMPGAIKSLNVSNAAAIALYAARSHLAD